MNETKTIFKQELIKSIPRYLTGTIIIIFVWLGYEFATKLAITLSLIGMEALGLFVSTWFKREND